MQAAHILLLYIISNLFSIRMQLGCWDVQDWHAHNWNTFQSIHTVYQHGLSTNAAVAVITVKKKKKDACVRFGQFLFLIPDRSTNLLAADGSIWRCGQVLENAFLYFYTNQKFFEL